MSARLPDPDALRYARYWEPLLAGPALRALGRIEAEPAVFLDVGAGTGAVVSAAAERWPAACIVALDASAGMLSVGRQRMARERPTDQDRLEWLAADALAMPLADASVGAALSSFVLQAVDDRASLLAEIRRVLRPGGTISIVSWLAGELVVGADAVLDELVRDAATDPRAHVQPSRSSDLRTADELAEELAGAGFTAIDVFTDELRHAWTRDAYLEFTQDYAERDLFETLDDTALERLLGGLRSSWATLPDAAFELRAPLVAATARRPSA